MVAAISRQIGPLIGPGLMLSGMKKQFSTYLMAAGLTVVLSACAPALNWREMPAADGKLWALFPAKPVTASRAWSVQAAQHTMTLTAARVGGAQFAAGATPAARGQTAAVARAWAAVLLRNMQVPADTIEQAKPVPVVGTQGAFELAVSGTVEGAPGLLRARFAWTDQAALATIAMGSHAQLQPADAQLFAASMRLP